MIIILYTILHYYTVYIYILSDSLYAFCGSNLKYWSDKSRISRLGRLRHKGMLESFVLKLRASFTLLYPSPLAKLPVKRTNRHTKWANGYSTRGKCSDKKYILSSSYESVTISSTHARKWRSNQLSHTFTLKVYSFTCYQYRTLPHVSVRSISSVFHCVGS